LKRDGIAIGVLFLLRLLASLLAKLALALPSLLLLFRRDDASGEVVGCDAAVACEAAVGCPAEVGSEGDVDAMVIVG
jgi:hypothetical protein